MDCCFANPLPPKPGLVAPTGRKAVSEVMVQRILDLVKCGKPGAGDRLPPECSAAEKAMRQHMLNVRSELREATGA